MAVPRSFLMTTIVPVGVRLVRVDLNINDYAFEIGAMRHAKKAHGWESVGFVISHRELAWRRRS